jgi:hypothetical protein
MERAPMTLVLTALTPRHAVQVSDRRVVIRYPSGVEKPRDGHVKAVVTELFACSYTGVADLRGDTADWLALHLCDRADEADHGIVAIAGAAERELAARRLSDQPLAVVCVGWSERDGQAVPIGTVVSNMGRSGIESRFGVTTISIAKGRPSAVFPIGQALTPTELARVNRSVRQLCTTGRDSARAIAQVLTESIREVARSPARRMYVSDDVLVTSLPRPDLRRGNLVVGRLVEDYMSVTNILGGGTRIERQGGPIIVGRGGAVQALPPEDGPPSVGITAAARILREPKGSLYVCILTDPPLGAAWSRDVTRLCAGPRES